MRATPKPAAWCHSGPRRAAALLIFVLLLLVPPAPAPAQGLGALTGLTGGNAAPDPEIDPARALAEAIRQAAGAGMSVIVLDSAGRPVTLPGAAPEPPETDTETARSTALMKAQMRGLKFRETLKEKLDALPVALNEVRYILRASSPTGEMRAFAEILIWSVILLAIGMALERGIYHPWITARVIRPRQKEAPQGYADKLPFLVLRFVTGLVGVLLGMGAAYLLGVLFFAPVDDTAVEFTITVINAAYFLCRAVALLWRMVLSPFRGRYRLTPLSDRDALVLYRWLWRLGALDICTQMFATWVYELGLNYDVYALFYGLAGLALALLNAAMVLFNRRAISNAIRNGRPAAEVSGPVRFIALFWAPVAIAWFAFAWLRLSVDLVLERDVPLPLIAGAYAVLMTTLVVYAAINYLIERHYSRARRMARLNAAPAPPPDGAPGAPDRERAALASFEDLARRASGILAFAAGAVVLLFFWGVANRLAEMPVIDAVLDLAVILFIGYVVYHGFRIWIDNKIRDESGDTPAETEPGDEGGAGSASRLATLLPLFRGFILSVILVTILLIALLQIGINVSPLFAGAGVVGLAIGFGAQTLVRDIFSGAFFLFDDAFRKGEYIDIGDVKGTVEKISVRSFQLRHHLGALHTIPFGEIRFLTNFSRDWVIMKLKLRVTYDTDVERVRKLIKKLGQQLLDDPEIGPQFIQPLKSQGVIEMQDSAMIIRVKFMTKPGDQWIIRKRVFQEIRDLFEREDIDFAHREVTVRLADADPASLTEEQKKAVAAAALGAEDEPAPNSGADDR